MERTGGLVRYVVSATLSRGADGGAAVGLVLVALTPVAHLARPSLVGGLLATCLSAPHVLGPVLARQLDRASDGRRTLAGACTLYGLALASASLGVGRLPLPAVLALVAAAGLCGPLLTGGLSSRLAGLVRSDEVAQRRAQGWDAVSYGIGGSAGPAAVAALAAAASPLVAMLLLSCAALLAGAMVLTLPPGDRAPVPAGVPPVRRTLRLIAVSGPLRRVACVTMITAMPGGAVAVIGTALSRGLGVGTDAGAVLAAAFGLGNFAGSLLVTALPLRGEPERLITRYGVVVGLAFGLCAAVPDFPLGVAAFGLVGAANAPFFTATLAARSAYSPPEARAQVFVSMAGLKVATAALGAALAGTFIDLGPRVLLVSGAVLTLLAAAVTMLDRRLGRALDEEPARAPAALPPATG